MKTLKKTLCLVLAVVMVVGVLVLPANAATTTAADADATAAFNTLNEYGVMYGVDANNTPALSKNINRQDMAAIIYRFMTGDTADKYVANYAPSANDFADSATFATWAKGYIGYVGSKGIFKGDNNGNFKPTEEIKGDDVLTVLLRCIGYGQNGEFTGANYAANAKAQAADINLFGGAEDYVNVPEDMSKVINRGAVAKLTFNAIQAPMAVVYNGTYSVYQDNQGRPSAPNAGATLNPSLVTYNDGKSAMKFDKWGAPYYEYAPTIKFNSSYNAAEKKLAKYIEKVAPLGEYWVPTTECDIAYDGKLTGNTTLNTFTNGAGNTDTQYIQPTDTIGTVGAQGQWIRTFDTIDNDNKTVIDRIVYVDTLLAQVVEVTKEEKDPAGHIKESASLGLYVYTTTDNDPTDDTTANYDIAGNDYKKGDFILLRAVAKADGSLADSIAADGSANYEVLGLAPSFTGEQTTIWYNQASHIIDTKTYPDNNRYNLDVAQNNGGTYVWFTDGQGNVIGSIDPPAAPASYAILTSMIWKTGNPGHAEATLLYMDGTTKTVTVASLQGEDDDDAWNEFGDGTAAAYSPLATDGSVSTPKFEEVSAGSPAVRYAYVSDEGRHNGMYQGYALYRVTETAAGVVLTATTFVGDANAQVQNKGTVINSASNVYVDDATVFYVRKVNPVTGITYDSYVGKDNVPSFTNDSSTTLTLFYVADTNMVAKYVYINQGTETTAGLSRLVAALSPTYSNGLYNGAPSYTLNSAFVGDKAVGAGVINASTDTNIQTLAENYNELYFVTYSNGLVTGIKVVPDVGLQVDDPAGADATATTTKNLYKLTAMTYKANGTLIANYGDGTATETVGQSWNLNLDSVKVYGKTKDQIKDLVFADVNAYAVVDGTNGNALLALYIFDKRPDDIPEPGPAPVDAFTKVLVAKEGTLAGTIELWYTDTSDPLEVRDAVIKAMQAAGYTEINTADGTAGGDPSDDYTYSGKKNGVSVSIALIKHEYFEISVSVAGSSCSSGHTLSVDHEEIYVDENGKAYGQSDAIASLKFTVTDTESNDLNHGSVTAAFTTATTSVSGAVANYVDGTTKSSIDVTLTFTSWGGVAAGDTLTITLAA